jgi:hypothetical protein
MRYAAMTQTLDVLARCGGFVPDAKDGRSLAPPGRSGFAGSRDRYTDAQLYARRRCFRERARQRASDGLDMLRS